MRRNKSYFLYLVGILFCAVLLVFLTSAGTECPRSYHEKNMPWYCRWCNTSLEVRNSRAELNENTTNVTTDELLSHINQSLPWYYHWYDRLRQGRKIILLYTTWFDLQEWYDLAGHGLYQCIDHCEKVNNCLITYDRSWIKEASAVLFHGRDIEENRNRHYSARKLREVRKGLPLTQKWIFLSHENPWKDKNVYKPYDGLFNWTATFNRKSNIFIPYQSYALRMKPQNVTRNYAMEKTGLVAWAVSNCGPKLRLEYVSHLQRYLSVTVYGKCNCYFAKRKFCRHFDNGCRKELSMYKFFLAFENDFCHDYVTEKYWERIQQDVVPVVMGSNYGGLAIPGSYIDASDFGSIRELADYLLYLDKNDDAYNKYFSYKTKYVDINGDFYCTICEKLNSEEANHRSQVILSEEFNYETNCGMGRRKIEKFKKQIESAMKDNSTSLTMYKKIKC